MPEISINQPQPPKKNFLIRHPYLTFFGFILLIISFYYLFLDPTPSKPIQNIRTAVTSTFGLIIIGAAILGAYILIKKTIGFKREFHPVPEIRKNVEQYFYEEHGIILDSSKLWIDELIKGGNQYAVHDPESKLTIIYDANIPKPHIRSELKDDLYLYKKQLLKEKFYPEYAKLKLEQEKAQGI